MSQPSNLAAMQPILSTGVSAEDLLITLNMLIDDTASGETMSDAENGSPSGGVDGVGPETLSTIQEALDALVESLGPSGEGQPITKDQLAQVFGSVPQAQLTSFCQRLASAVQQAGMQGEPAGAQPAASSSSSVVGASSTGSKKSTSSAASSSGGGLDLSISGFAIKPPPGHPAASGKK